MLKKYLIDESLIVFLDRAEKEVFSPLSQFLEDGRGEENQHLLYMPYSSKLKLGGMWRYSIRAFLYRFFHKNSTLKKYRTEALLRLSTAKTYIQGNNFLKLGWIQRGYYKTKIIDFYIDANNRKSKELEGERGEKIKPHELISFDMCEIALIATKKKFILISFNKDYRFLSKTSGDSQLNFNFQWAEDFLKNYQTH